MLLNSPPRQASVRLAPHLVCNASIRTRTTRGPAAPRDSSCLLRTRIEGYKDCNARESCGISALLLCSPAQYAVCSGEGGVGVRDCFDA